MKTGLLIGIALVASALPAAAFADDPKDPSMRNAAARARDSAETRRLNMAELERVRERDARDAQGWHAARAADNTANAEYALQSAHYRNAMADYARDRAQYERRMADWRRSVAACHAGGYSACD